MDAGRTLLPWLPALISAAVLTGVFVICSGCYTIKQGTAMLGYLGRAVPLEELAGENIPESDRLFAERVADITRFAVEELGLKKSKNYTRYVALDRDYLAAVVSACAGDSFTRRLWRFPVVGAVPYKGFFDPKDAGKEAERLRKEGFDVWVRKVDAFSTLGWFRDPLYSYMKDYSAHELANLIIHELLHATVFVRGQVQFNEQLAAFTGDTGAALYVESRFGPDSAEYRSIGEAAGDQAAFRTFLRGLCGELETVYASAMGREEKLAEKARIIAAAMERFDAKYDACFQTENFRSFSQLPINNAYLDLYRLYYEEDRFFTGLYERLPDPEPGSTGGVRRLRAFIAAAAGLSGSKAARKDPRGELSRALDPAYPSTSKGETKGRAWARATPSQVSVPR